MEPEKYTKIIRKRRIRLADREGWKSVGMRLLTVLVILGILFSTVFFLTRISGNAMMPAVHDGDVLLGYRLEGNYSKGDIVQYQKDGKTYIGRIAAAGMETVNITEEGQVLVDGNVEDGDILFKTEPGTVLTYPYQVPAGSFFILGDYRTAAQDSRTLGPVSQKDIDGKIITLFRRRNL